MAKSLMLHKHSPLQKLPRELKNSSFLSSLFTSNTPGGHRDMEPIKRMRMIEEATGEDPYSLVPPAKRNVVRINYSFLTDPRRRIELKKKAKDGKLGKMRRIGGRSKSTTYGSGERCKSILEKLREDNIHDSEGVPKEEFLQSLNLTEERSPDEIGEEEFKIIRRVVRRVQNKYEPQNCGASTNPIILENACSPAAFSKYRKCLLKLQDRLREEEEDMGTEIPVELQTVVECSEPREPSVTQNPSHSPMEKINIFELTSITPNNPKTLNNISPTSSTLQSTGLPNIPHITATHTHSPSSGNPRDYTHHSKREKYLRGRMLSRFTISSDTSALDNILNHKIYTEDKLNGRSKINKSKDLAKLPGKYLFKALEEGLSSDNSDNGGRVIPPPLFEKGGGYDRIKIKMREFKEKMQKVKAARKHPKHLKGFSSYSVVEGKESDPEEELGRIEGATAAYVKRLNVESRIEIEDFRRRQLRFLRRMRNKVRFSEKHPLNPRSAIVDGVLSLRRNKDFLSHIDSPKVDHKESTENTEPPSPYVNLQLFPETTQLLQDLKRANEGGSNSPSMFRTPFSPSRDQDPLLEELCTRKQGSPFNNSMLNLDYSGILHNIKNLEENQSPGNNIGGVGIGKGRDAGNRARALLKLFLQDCHTTTNTKYKLPQLGNEYDLLQTQLKINTPLRSNNK